MKFHTVRKAIDVNHSQFNFEEALPNVGANEVVLKEATNVNIVGEHVYITFVIIEKTEQKKKYIKDVPFKL